MHGRALAGLLGTVLAVGACGGPAPEDDQAAPTTEGPTHSPFTGLPLDRPAPERPALIVKVDNTARARPQLGLGAADLVVEEPVEGGLTRLALFFYLQLPDEVGPVRSLRTSDIAIVAPTGGVLVASGGAAKAKQVVADAGVRMALPGADASGFYRAADRVAPYNLMLRPNMLVEDYPAQPAPEPYFSWDLASTEPTGGDPATTVAVRFSARHTTRWSFTDGRGWLREPDLSATGDGFAAQNVLVLRVRTEDAGYRDPAGNPVPEVVLTGDGDALLLHEGQAIAARWSKDAAEDPIELLDDAARPLLLPPGHTWVELVPERGSVTWSP